MWPGWSCRLFGCWYHVVERLADHTYHYHPLPLTFLYYYQIRVWFGTKVQHFQLYNLWWCVRFYSDILCPLIITRKAAWQQGPCKANIYKLKCDCVFIIISCRKNSLSAGTWWCSWRLCILLGGISFHPFST